MDALEIMNEHLRNELQIGDCLRMIEKLEDRKKYLAKKLDKILFTNKGKDNEANTTPTGEKNI